MATRLERLRKSVDTMNGIDRVMMDDLIKEYDALASMTEKLRIEVEKDGVMIDKEVGTVNNRHTEKVENPAFTAYSKSIGRLGDLAKKVSAFAKGNEEVEVDELAGFVGR